VQTLHNYRLFCPNGLFFRDGRPCEDCLHKRVPWPAVLHACYRGSRVASLAAGGTFAVHHALGTWTREVDRYVALTSFAQGKFVEGGLAPDKVMVKPNVVHPDHGPGTGEGGYALFVGRLSLEKGIQTVISAWGSNLPLPLVVAGDGPLADVVQRGAAKNRIVTWVGHRSPDEVQALLARATCVIVPSICYETFGLVVAEAFGRGTPVIAARHGALGELVEHGRTGLQFIPGDVADLRRQVAWIAEHPQEVSRMRIAARSEYEARYSVDSNYPVLCRIYSEAIASRRARDTGHS
jgi:glycosyltransferase involved in cell wall biosynthesis